MKLALIDLDGVVANDNHRIQYALAKEWVEYFRPERMGADSVWTEGQDLVRSLQDDGWTIAYLTGRRSALREVTEAWLATHEFPFGVLYMREPIWIKDGLLQDAPEWPEVRLADFKVETIRRIVSLRSPEDVVLYDDDPEVVRTVQEQISPTAARLCTWNEKPEAMVTFASA